MGEDAADVTIAVFAHVQAAVDEEFPLAEVLEREGISARAWSKAEIDVRQRVAREVLARVDYEEALVAAQDRFERAVAPVDEDLGSWLALLDGVAAAPAPFAYLTRLGLRLSDVARLKRRWARRAEDDEEFGKKVAELRAKPLPKLPPLRVGKSVYAGSGRVRTPGVAPAGEAVHEAAEIDGLGIDRLAALGAELARSPKERATILRRFGLDAKSHDAISARFVEAFGRDPSLERDYRHLLAHHEQRLRSGADAGASAPAAHAPSPALAAPFAAPVFAGAAAAPVAEARAPDPVELARQLGKRLAAQGLSLRGTALAPEAPAGKALPFVPGPPRPIAASTPRVASEPAPVTPEAAEAARRLGEKLRGGSGRTTAPADERPRPPTLPFAAVGAREPSLTIEQHASLTVELTRAPASADEVLARYGLTVAKKAALDVAYEKRFVQQPALRAEWERAYRAYETWLATR